MTRDNRLALLPFTDRGLRSWPSRSWRLAALGALVTLGVCAPAGQPPTAGAQADAELPPDTPKGQLPRTVVPVAYRLDLQVVPDEPEFSGQATIEVEVREATDRIWLHGRNLTVDSVTISSSTGGVATPATYRQVTPDGVALVELAEEVPPGPATLRFVYRAPFDSQLEGLYRVQEGERWYAFTQFEAISARLCFPGFDEPAFKTPFDVSIATRADHVAVANTPEVASETAGEGMIRRRFGTTQPLPTYLVAMAVGPLDVVEGSEIPANAVRPHPVPLRGLAVAGKGSQLAYALRHTGPILAALEEYLGVAYPFEKLDIVAVPDFAAGAMENVGLITFREWLLLLDDEAPAQQKRAFAYVMAHELGHQWFGNLVTMPWWDDIWLNESFATWSESVAIAAWEPTYRAEIAQVLDTLRAFDSDSLSSSRQVRQPIESNHDIHNAFDRITYEKGAAVLAMFERYLGRERFQAGIRHYLQRHAHGSASYREFLAALSEGAGADVTAPFESFLLQSGVPLLEITPRCAEGKAEVHVAQRRYLPAGSPADATRVWQVPACLRFGMGADGVGEQCTMLTRPEQNVALEANSCPQWLLPNADAAGYYRWTLPAEELERLGANVAALTPRDLLSLADAVRAGFAAGTVSAPAALAFAERLAGHPERAVATALMGVVRFARERLVEPDERSRVEDFGRRVFGPAMERLGLGPAAPEEESEVRLFRRELVSFLAEVGQDAELRGHLRTRAEDLLNEDAQGAGAIDAELTETALTVAVQDADGALADRLIAELSATQDPDRRRSIVAALSHADDPQLAARLREWIFQPVLRTNEVYAFLAGLMSVEEVRRPTWTWITESFDRLAERMPPYHMGRLPWLAAAFCSREDARAVQSFFEERVEDLPGGPRNLKAATEAIELCATRVETHRDAARTFFAAPGSAAQAAGARAR